MGLNPRSWRLRLGKKSTTDRGANTDPPAETPPDPAASTSADSSPTAADQSSDDSVFAARRSSPDRIATVATRYAKTTRASHSFARRAVEHVSRCGAVKSNAGEEFDAWFQGLEFEQKESYRDSLLLIIFYSVYLIELLRTKDCDWPTKARRWEEIIAGIAEKRPQAFLRLLLVTVMTMDRYLSADDYPRSAFTKETVPKSREGRYFVLCFESVRKDGAKAFAALWEHWRQPNGLGDVFEEIFPSVMLIDDDGRFERAQSMFFPVFGAILLMAGGVNEDQRKAAFASVACSLDVDAERFMIKSAPGVLAALLMLKAHDALRALGTSKHAEQAPPSAESSTAQPAADEHPDLVKLEADTHTGDPAVDDSDPGSALHGLKVDTGEHGATTSPPESKGAGVADDVVTDGILPGCEAPYEPDQAYLSDDDGNAVNAEGKIVKLRGQRDDGTMEDALPS